MVVVEQNAPNVHLSIPKASGLGHHDRMIMKSISYKKSKVINKHYKHTKIPINLFAIFFLQKWYKYYVWNPYDAVGIYNMLVLMASVCPFRTYECIHVRYIKTRFSHFFLGFLSSLFDFAMRIFQSNKVLRLDWIGLICYFKRNFSRFIHFINKLLVLVSTTTSHIISL